MLSMCILKCLGCCDSVLESGLLIREYFYLELGLWYPTVECGWISTSSRLTLIVGFGVCSAGILIEDKNWPPFIPIKILHHDIANDIPAHTQQLQTYAYYSWLGTNHCCGVD